MARATHFLNGTTVTAREAEVTLADFDGGMNNGGSNAPGIGINLDGGAVVGTPEQFTLLDQVEAARVPQNSQHLGGDGYTDPAEWPSSGGDAVSLPAVAIIGATNSDTGDGTVTDPFGADLASLAAGWTAAV